MLGSLLLASERAVVALDISNDSCKEAFVRVWHACCLCIARLEVRGDTALVRVRLLGARLFHDQLGDVGVDLVDLREATDGSVTVTVAHDGRRATASATT